MVLSLEPELRVLELQAKAPTLPSWPLRTLTSLHLFTSQIYTKPLFVPTDRWLPRLDQQTDVTESR